jgi:hypothetical protein
LTKHLTKLLLTIVAFCFAASAHGLTIVPTFDVSISGNATDGPAMVGAVNAAIKILEANYADNFTVNITFVVDTNVDLAENETAYSIVDYSHYRAALQSKATSANDALALSQLPNTSTDPVVGGTQMIISTPLANMLGLSTDSSEGTEIRFNTNLLYFSRPNPNGNYCDLQSAMEHEMDEVLGGGGAGCNLDAFPQIGALDLFRYATNSANSTLARSWTLTNGDNAYFSVDGTNLWARFNTVVGADLGDFWGFNQDPNTLLPLYWAPPGTTPHAEVQDAFATPSYFSYPDNFMDFPTTNYYYENTSPDLGTNELTMLDVIGWTLSANLKPATAPSISLARSGTHQITLSWPTNVAGYTLQETTNLASGSWVASATGAKTPAVITITNTQKFYRLDNPTLKPAIVPSEPVEVEPTDSSPSLRAIHVWMPSNAHLSF